MYSVGPEITFKAVFDGYAPTMMTLIQQTIHDDKNQKQEQNKSERGN